MKIAPTTKKSALAKPVAAVYDRRSVRRLSTRTTANPKTIAFGISTPCPLCLDGKNPDNQLTQNRSIIPRHHQGKSNHCDPIKPLLLGTGFNRLERRVSSPPASQRQNPLQEAKTAPSKWQVAEGYGNLRKPAEGFPPRRGYVGRLTKRTTGRLLYWQVAACLVEALAKAGATTIANHYKPLRTIANHSRKKFYHKSSVSQCPCLPRRSAAKADGKSAQNKAKPAKNRPEPTKNLS
jgi:hypothetical protein